MKIINMTFRLVAVVMLSMSGLFGMPTVDVPAQDSASAAEGMPDASAMQAMPVGVPPAGAIPQGGMPPVMTDKKADRKDQKKDGASTDKKAGPSILQMKELKFVDDGLKGAGKVIDLFVGPFEDFGDAIPPTVSSLFGPFAHIHWSLIIRSMQKRIKKAREEFEGLTGKPKSVEVKIAKPEVPVDFMAAMQQEILKKEPEQKKRISITKFMPKKVIKKIYDELLVFVKKATKPLEKKSLAVAELFEPLPPIPFLVTVSDIQLALHILGLQQRLAIIEESLKNKLEPLEDVKKRALKDAIKVQDLDPMVAMAVAPELTPEQKKKADEKKKKEERKKNEVSGVKLKETKQVQSVYSAFKKLDSMTSFLIKPIQKLTKDISPMPVPLVSFVASYLAMMGAGFTATGILAIYGLPMLAFASSLYGVSQTQFSIYIRNLQQLLGKIEGDIKNFQEAKKQAGTSENDPSKVLAQGQEQIGQQDNNTAIQDGAGMPNVSGIDQAAALPDMSGVGAIPLGHPSIGGNAETAAPAE